MHPLFETDDFVIHRTDNSRRQIRHALQSVRDERRPYLILTPQMTEPTIERILVPVSMLEEEVYKAQICTYIARHLKAHIILLQANDYGSKAAQNIGRMITHFQSVATSSDQPFTWQTMIAKKDSFALMKESAERVGELNADMLFLTASREYGLDDWLFGPQELRSIQLSTVPVLLINPRNDLFSLCD